MNSDSYNQKDMSPPKHEHPAITMSKARSVAWNTASDEHFYRFISKLAHIYAKRKYTGNGSVDNMLLFKDFKKWHDSI